MQHLDEHIIEMYVLGSELVAGRRGEIAAHLRECAGCRTLAEQMEEFYRRAGEGLNEASVREPAHGRSLVRSRNWIEPYERQHAMPAPYRATTWVGRFTTYVRSHPVTASAAGFAMVAALAALTFVSGKNFLTDSNPSYVHLNTEQSRIEVYNRDHDMLWSLPSRSLHHVDPNTLADLYKAILLYDLDGDGRREVLTSLAVGEEGGDGFRSPLTVFSHDKKILRQLAFEEHIEFRGVKYDDRLSVDRILCDRYSPAHEPEILVTANNARSPNVLFRLDNKMNVLGSYVHYGYVRISLAEWGDGVKKVLLFGQNDLGEIDSVASPVLAIIDPTKISGKSESSGSRGFGLPASPAEMYYIRFPLSDMNYALNSLGAVHAVSPITKGGHRIYNVFIRGSSLDAENQTPNIPHFEYFLSEDFTVTEVKYSSATLRLRQRLAEQVKLRGTFDKAYLENLKHGVRYWDGKVWSAKPVRVQNPVASPIP